MNFLNARVNANLIINFSLPYQRPSQLTFLEIDRERVKHLNTFELSKNQKASLELSKHSKFEVKCQTLYCDMHLYKKRCDFFTAKNLRNRTHFWCMQNCLGFVYKCMRHYAREQGNTCTWSSGDLATNYTIKISELGN